ncbi:uncharacterized protein A1O5_01753 [Cladophialophora psammophila CBS 110553]|uniref:Pyruvate decarboxylase n=1 Tax=Cladophialophora psammophila CBS 110553 TaxID=1182543 RepID=W9X3J3_9EURO|nr:uncharacterized protein A1O5_01753 [Cladophialophora psammophila CBS 110553]EXJ75057.1 hypothetical protein A1O5_01753 [Cladophialophora psammophila CBS 110553]
MKQVTLGSYIFRRLKQLGIDHIFGCPGDFTLNLLDYIYPEGLKWVGTCNELNGAYAADGYARTKGDGTPGVVITTYGVGELSALNGIAGAYSEHVPIIHIVGTTTRAAQKARTKIHHTLGDDGWDHTIYQKMSEPARRASVFLTNDATFTEEVDFVIERAYQTRHPVYLFIPMDTPDIFVPSDRLESETLNTEIINVGREEAEGAVVDAIVTAMSSSKTGALLVDVLSQRYGLLDQVNQISDLWNATTFIAPLAKSHYDETKANYGGIYNGILTTEDSIKTRIEDADQVVHVGPLLSDSNTGVWTQNLSPENSIVLHPDWILVNGIRHDLSFVPVVKRVARALMEKKQVLMGGNETSTSASQNTRMHFEGRLDHARLWKCLSGHLKEDDCIVAEVGTAQYGALELRLGARNSFLTQMFFSAIGYAVPALLGALCARREQGASGRVLFLAGDGGLQMTVQELGTIVRHGFSPTIVLLDNNGYTTERIIHGPTLQHNDIARWDHGLMLEFFGCQTSKYYQVREFEELEKVFQCPAVLESRTPQLIHLYLGEMDCPAVLVKKSRIGKERNMMALAQSDKEFGRRRNIVQ